MLPFLFLLFLGAGLPQGTAALNLLQWNPHWECHVKSTTCNDAATSELNELLPQLDIDFLNLIEMPYQPPEGWMAFQFYCGRDLEMIIYNHKKWRPVAGHSSMTTNVSGCFETSPNNRPFIVQAFDSVRDSYEHRYRLIVVGAHFSHTHDDAHYAPLREALLRVTSNASTNAVVMMADSNIAGSTSSADLLKNVGAPHVDDKTLATALYKTCCSNDGFTYQFDRIVANFGEDMQSTLLFDPTPAWVGPYPFHRAVFGSVVGWTEANTPIHPNAPSSTTTTTATTTPITEPEATPPTAETMSPVFPAVIGICVLLGAVLVCFTRRKSAPPLLSATEDAFELEISNRFSVN